LLIGQFDTYAQLLSVDAVLIGESLMRSADRKKFLREMIATSATNKENLLSDTVMWSVKKFDICFFSLFSIK
jgi:hypothetical protein